MKSVEHLLRLVAGVNSAECVFNPWSDIDGEQDITTYGADGDGGPFGRLARLRQHFECPAPRLLLVGEAPGYAGCHFSGVPFTNERLILEGRVPRVTAEGRFTRRPKPWSEPAATIMWDTLHRIDMAQHVVMWNAFPFHPYQVGNMRSNRAPNRGELEARRAILEAVLAHFKGVLVIAVGLVAYKALQSLGVSTHARVRHPSMGGATEFREQMRTLYLPF